MKWLDDLFKPNQVAMTVTNLDEHQTRKIIIGSSRDVDVDKLLKVIASLDESDRTGWRLNSSGSFEYTEWYIQKISKRKVGNGRST